MTIQKLKGIIAAPFTPFDETGNLNLRMIPVLVNSLKKNGVNGAFICGSTGEGVSLTLEEKKQVFAAWGRETSTNLKLISLVGGTSVLDSQTLALHAQACGHDAISLVAPYYFKPANVEQLVDFCAEVTSVVPTMPFYFYHIPVLSGCHYSMYEFLQIADEKIPNLAGIKYTQEDLMDFSLCLQYKNQKYDLLWGRDECLLAAMAMGAKGGVGSTYNYAAPLYHQLIKAFEEGDLRRAKELQNQSISFIRLLGKYGGIGTGKAFMKLVGMDCGEFRSPVKNPSPEQLEKLKTDLENIGFFNYCSRV
ncbi:dihydrodipicolinate synthase family protein [Flexithrix dorotheae]|uniref:dihydrodipicolinate synthase family protein n=1 Tax=Flexithrix dorotheae TaxID=70993 RepID=UPI000373A463|nr:dihydrodipicolinate synthase family protein [Flexithrix dorotheae]